MIIDLYNTRCRVHGNLVEIGWLNSYLAFDDQSTAYRRGRDGRAKRVKPQKIRLFDFTDESFPTGLLALVYQKVREMGWTITFNDCRRPCPLPIATDLSWLRSYQREAVDAAIKKGRGILHEPTGAGKSEIAAGIIKSFPVYWTFIVHRSGLMYQTAERFREREIPGVGILGDGKSEIGDRVTVTTFQTMWAQKHTSEVKSLFVKSQGLLVDESHVLPGPTLSQVAAAFDEARYRFGLSGTPLDRSDQRSLITIGAIGPIIHRTRANVLIDAGVLAKPDIRMVRVEQAIERPTYTGVYGEGVIRSTKRNSAIISCVKNATKPCLVFVTNLKHGNILLNTVKSTGMSAFFVQGNVDELKRQELKDKLRNKQIDVVIASVVWQEGIDIPELSSVVIAGGGRSVIAALQRVGRGMRRAAGKDTFEVWDIADVGNRILERHSKARIAAYSREGYDVRHVSFGVSAQRIGSDENSTT